MHMRTVEISVGAFILAGIFALILLGFKVSNLSLTPNRQTYTLYAEFDNVGSLSERARVAIGGVTIGRVSSVVLNKKTYMAKVTLNIDSQINNIPVDSTVSIMTAGLLGEKYIGISIGGESKYLKPGDTFTDTQSALILENLIGKFLLKSGASGMQSNTAISGSHEQF